jgi:hypothetical protein
MNPHQDAWNFLALPYPVPRPDEKIILFNVHQDSLHFINFAFQVFKNLKIVHIFFSRIVVFLQAL